MTDSPRALKYTTAALSLLSRFPLHLSSDPLLALNRLQLALLIDGLSSMMTKEATSIDEQRERDSAVDIACRFGARCVAGVSAILPHAHPIRGIALAELGKLLCVDVDSSASQSQIYEVGNDETEGSTEAPLPRGAVRLQLAAQVLVRAREELIIGFGRGGGDVGKEVDAMIRDLERESNVWNKVAPQARNSDILGMLS